MFSNKSLNSESKTLAYNQIKNEMNLHNLKSKDFKKFIEYGWLYTIDDFNDETKGYKLNFRDGLQKICGLSAYAKRYEISSEIIHSSPLLIYSRKEYFYYLTLINLYESFFRLESVFVSLLSKRVSKEVMSQYQKMRSLYYLQLQEIHKRELAAFAKKAIFYLFNEFVFFAKNDLIFPFRAVYYSYKTARIVHPSSKRAVFSLEKL